MRKIKEILFSENGMKVVNTLFFWRCFFIWAACCLSLILSGSVILCFALEIRNPGEARWFIRCLLDLQWLWSEWVCMVWYEDDRSSGFPFELPALHDLVTNFFHSLTCSAHISSPMLPHRSPPHGTVSFCRTRWSCEWRDRDCRQRSTSQEYLLWQHFRSRSQRYFRCGRLDTRRYFRPARHCPRW